MAKLSHCGRWARATVYRVLSSIPAYKYQCLFVATCSGKCGKRIRYWCGEFADGTQTDLTPVTAEEYKAKWARRIKTEKPRPKIQMTSEYSQRIKSGNIDVQVRYQNRIKRALNQGF